MRAAFPSISISRRSAKSTAIFDADLPEGAAQQGHWNRIAEDQPVGQEGVVIVVMTVTPRNFSM